MTLVIASTDDVPELADVIRRRHETGQDICDEWWEGTYRIMTGPSPLHGMTVVELAVFLNPLAKRAGLKVSTPVNIGVDKVDCRVPDIGVFHPDTLYTSPAFLSSAELVVEVLSPGEKSSAKLGFYIEWDVSEYLEIDPAQRRINLTGLKGPRPPGDEGSWMERTRSFLGFTLEGADRLVTGDGTVFELPAL